MIKNIKRLMDGFSIAELLLSILISAIIAAAMVPIVGPKKIKAPMTRFSHGMAQCYYMPENPDGTPAEPDENGDFPNNMQYRMYYFYTDNNPNNPVDGKPIPVEGNYCTFVTPNADFYEVIAIGAGGDAYTNYSGTDFKIEMGGLADEVGSGYIHGDNRFQSDITNASIAGGIKVAPQLRTILNQWADPENSKIPDNAKNKLYALYELQSPLGKGGNGACMREVIRTSSCLNKCNTYDDEINCHGPFRYNTLYYYSQDNGGVGDISYGVYNAYQGEQAGTLVRSNQAINGSFYSENDVSLVINKGWASPGENCWYYRHAAGYPSGDGIKIDRDKIPVKLYLDAYGNIKLTQTKEKSEVYYTTAKDPSLEIYARLLTSGNGQSPYIESGTYIMPAYKKPADATCEEKGLMQPVCGNTTRTPSNPAAPGGQEIDLRCDLKYSYEVKGSVSLLCENNGVKYDIYSSHCGYDYPSGADHDILLRWAYKGQAVNLTFGEGGSPGKEETMVFENINPGKKLYMFPAAKNAPNRYSYVSTTYQNSYEKRFIAAESGADKSAPGHTAFGLFTSDLPIPEKPYLMAVPDNRGYFKYLSKIEGVNTVNVGGLKNCSDYVCPGFAGNGIYPMFDRAPEGFGIKVKNYTNGAEFSGISEDNEINTSIQDIQCQNGSQIDSINVEFGRAIVCKEKRQKGNPGAVIIIW